MFNKHNEKKTFRIISGSFIDQTLEDDFKEYNLRLVKRIVFYVLIFFSINNLLLNIIEGYTPDDIYSGAQAVFFSRLFALMYGLYIMARLKAISDYDIFERLVFSYILFIVMVNLIVHYEYPHPERLTYSLELMIVLAIYLVFPINIRFQLVGAILFTLTNFVSLDSTVQSEKLYSHTIGMMINVNIVGFIAGRYFHLVIRQLYLAVQQQIKLKKSYESIFTKLKTVSGLVPICRTCKSVQNVDGVWDRFEEFVTSNSEIKLTHSICPSCSEKMFKEIQSHKPQ